MLPHRASALLSLFFFIGCAEPAADDETVAGSDQAATTRAPEDVEADAMVGHELAFVAPVVIPPGTEEVGIGNARIREVTDVVIDRQLYCAARPVATSGAKRTIEPGKYWVSKVEPVDYVTQRNGYAVTGVDIILNEPDQKTPSDFSIRCIGLSRYPLAREVMQAFAATVTVDPAVLQAKK